MVTCSSSSSVAFSSPSSSGRGLAGGLGGPDLSFALSPTRPAPPDACLSSLMGGGGARRAGPLTPAAEAESGLFSEGDGDRASAAAFSFRSSSLSAAATEAPIDGGNVCAVDTAFFSFWPLPAPALINFDDESEPRRKRSSRWSICVFACGRDLRSSGLSPSSIINDSLASSGSPAAVISVSVRPRSSVEGGGTSSVRLPGVSGGDGDGLRRTTAAGTANAEAVTVADDAAAVGLVAAIDDTSADSVGLVVARATAAISDVGPCS